MDKARRSIRQLMDIAPKMARVRRSGGEAMIPVEEILVGDVMIVSPGEKIAMDGIILSGESAINQAAITGESIPVEKGPGAEVYAGSLNAQGALEVKVTKLSGHDHREDHHMVRKRKGNALRPSLCRQVRLGLTPT